jgi:tRNA-uridine 2-sulfurtransferase
MRVCAHLGVPFLECDLEATYRDEVAMYMIDEYKKGRTPNPDVMCNKKVKFGGFLEFALERGSDYVATGHYAQVEEKDGVYFLKQSKDENKDQTYFLWTLTQDQLSKTLFPVGHLEKTEVRALAEKYNLPTATKKDSQGVCFLGMIDMKEFLSHYIERKVGAVLNTEGKIIGSHDGAVFVTLGQRHGFTITKKTTDDKPYYVISKNIEDNTITVADNLETVTDNLEKEDRELRLTQVVFHGDLDEQKIYQARIRYRQKLQDCTLKKSAEGELLVRFENPQLSVSKGQSCVIYDSELCVGGGVIE